MVGIVFKEAKEDDRSGLSYCYLYVENERLGRPGEESGLWRDLVGNEKTCLGKEDETPPATNIRIRYPYPPVSTAPKTGRAYAGGRITVW